MGLPRKNVPVRRTGRAEEMLTVGPPVQAAGAAQLQPWRGERQVMRGRRHWKRKQTPALLPRPPRRRAAIRHGLAPRLPYGVSGDTGKAGVGEAEESLPLLAGEKVLPLIPSGSGGYAGATVWNWHRESSEGPGWPTAGGQEAGPRAQPRRRRPRRAPRGHGGRCPCSASTCYGAEPGRWAAATTGHTTHPRGELTGSGSRAATRGLVQIPVSELF